MKQILYIFIGLTILSCQNNSEQISSVIKSPITRQEIILSSKIDSVEISEMTSTDLRLLRNEIFARHGYIFKSQELTDYFSKFDWYQPNLTSDQVDKELSETDRYNISLIKSLENDKQKNNTQENEKIDNRKLAFQNNEFISCYDFSTRKTKNLTEGFDPCISPDGNWIVFTQSSSTGNDFSRIIKIINTENSTIKDLEINDNNHFGAIWSPTGEYLAFSIMTNHWQIGLIKPNSTEFKIISSDSDIGIHAPTWSQDGKYIYAHNLSVLYKFDTSGKLIDKYDLSKLFGEEFYFSSSTRFCFTSDNKKMIFDCGIDEFIEGLNEPSSAIFCYDFNTKSTKRISKKGLCASFLWIDKQDKIYFSGFKNINEPRKIYQTSLKDTTLIELINGMRPSIGQ